jgi:hypothetical protein
MKTKTFNKYSKELLSVRFYLNAPTRKSKKGQAFPDYLPPPPIQYQSAILDLSIINIFSSHCLIASYQS